MKPNPVVLKSVSVSTASATPATTKPSTNPQSPKHRKPVKIDRSVKNTKVVHKNLTTTAGSKQTFTLFKKATNVTSEKANKDKTGKSAKHVKLNIPTKISANKTTIIKPSTSKKKSASKPKPPRTHPFVRKKSSTNSTSTKVRHVPKSHPPPKHSKLGTIHRQDNTGKVVQVNGSIWRRFPKGESNMTVSKKWWKMMLPTNTTVPPGTSTTMKPTDKPKYSRKSDENYFQAYSDTRAQQDVPAPQASFRTSPYGTSSWNEWEGYSSAGGNLDRSSKSQNSLDVPPIQLVRKHRDLKNERACKRMMRDMEAFERDEQQKSEELMMVSFRDGVDEVQTLMHSWVKTPVHVMEALTFVSIMACMILYWVEISIQSRLRKKGFNI
ncbi:hypothetical protein RvY_00026 [Ramazzottius varieornatus]|uniref:Uncharacterized protein n=1 Tax=Ramazzottius varieornatus TaxID=947166 RepID=A0A1D1UF02_RAMVA|nr:hypothetical protein RvY_00026 [Ramazzottius varieornatus]